jgi:hypothetical protein
MLKQITNHSYRQRALTYPAKEAKELNQKKLKIVILDVGADMPTFLKGLAQGLKEADRQ